MKTEERRSTLSPATTGPGDPAAGLPPTFTSEESIVMRAFAAGKTDKQVSAELHIPLPSFQRLLRNLMEKTGTSDLTGIHVWALRQKQSADSRQADRDYKWKRPV